MGFNSGLLHIQPHVAEERVFPVDDEANKIRAIIKNKTNNMQGGLFKTVNIVANLDIVLEVGKSIAANVALQTDAKDKKKKEKSETRDNSAIVFIFHAGCLR